MPWFCKLCSKDYQSSIWLIERLLGLCHFDLLSFVDAAPSFEVSSNLVDLPNLSDFDIDGHMPQNIDSRYVTLP